WRGAAQLADELMARDAFAAGLRLSPEGAKLADELGLPQSAELSWAIRNRAIRPRGTFHIQGFIDAGGWRERAHVVRRSLLPKPAWICAQTPWARRGGPALIAAYAMHIARAPLWALRAWHFNRRARRKSPPRRRI
ncbi:MAG: hypothetical protein H0W96_07035, partial [Solirubrobacterales bacterium]|nr:hypothetical protein [Solirubrobacterales bacterium]